MKIGIIFFLAGLALVFYLLNIHFQKKVLKNLGVLAAALMVIYGVILMVQPDEDEYVKFTKTTISKEKSEKPEEKGK